MSLGHLSQVTLTKGTKLDVPAPLMSGSKHGAGSLSNEWNVPGIGEKEW